MRFSPRTKLVLGCGSILVLLGIVAATAEHLNTLVGRFRLEESQGEVIARRQPADWDRERPATRRAV